MAKYLIYAYENLYGGLHGMCSYTVVEKRDDRDAFETAAQLSREVIDSYDCILQDLEEEVREYHDETDDEFADDLEQVIEEDIAYEVYKINVKAVDHDPTVEELEDLFWEDEDYFFEHYCSLIPMGREF